ncbi:hypothetical protein B0H19DRAFT_1270814 [Mycena capillaripes]|nr:hypothetical protein B0H19DRAFT_1270814 [Mycena capillaripes]
MCLQSDRDHIAHNAPDESLVVVHKGTDPHKFISILNDTSRTPSFFPVPQPRSMASPYIQATFHLSITTSFSCSPLAWSSLSSSVCFIDQAKCRQRRSMPHVSLLDVTAWTMRSSCQCRHEYSVDPVGSRQMAPHAGWRIQLVFFIQW